MHAGHRGISVCKAIVPVSKLRDGLITSVVKLGICRSLYSLRTQLLAGKCRTHAYAVRNPEASR